MPSNTNPKGGILRRCCRRSSTRPHRRTPPSHRTSSRRIPTPRRDRHAPEDDTPRRISTNINLRPGPLRRLPRHHSLRPCGVHLARRGRGARERAAPLLEIAVCGRCWGRR